MKKLLCSANLLVILVLVLAGIFISGASRTREPRKTTSVVQQQSCDTNSPSITQEQRPTPSHDPNNPKTIVVEAYLAQIPDEALIEIGLPLIPTKESETITVDKLLKCLDSTKAKGKIISSGRWTMLERQQCKIEQNNKFYLKREQITGGSSNGSPVTSVMFDQYTATTLGEIVTSLTKNNKISLDINFNYSGIFPKNREKTDNETPPAWIQFEFGTDVSLDNDVQVIIGAVKQGDSVLYLVIRAKILDE
jgi:hypothetical protein